MERKLMNGKVYKEIDFEEVLSSHSGQSDIFYHVFYGTVDWNKDGNEQKAICIFMKYKGKVNVLSPANVLISDLFKVEEAIAKVKQRNLILN